MNITHGIPTRALVIAEPWIGLILAGRKTWEMRTKPTNIRGCVGLIRKGSGLVVGTAELVDSLPALNAAGLAVHVDRHGIPSEQHAHVLADGWVVPWVLSEVRPLVRPVPYMHRPGAVTWVTLDAAIGAAIAGAG